MRRTETAGNPLKKDGNFRNKIKDPKYQTFTKITQMQDEEATLVKRIQILREKHELLLNEITEKQKLIDEKRLEVIGQKRNMVKTVEKKREQKKPDNDKQDEEQNANIKKINDGESIRRSVRNLEAKLDSLSQKKNEYDALKSKLRTDINKLRKDKGFFEKILKGLKIELQNIEEKVEEAQNEQNQALVELQTEMMTLADTKKTSVLEWKRFGKEFQTVYKFFEDENLTGKLQEKFQSRNSQSKLLKHQLNEPMDQDEADSDDSKKKVKSNIYGSLDMETQSSKRKKKQQEDIKRKRQENNFNEKNLQDLKADVERYDNTFNQLMEETKSNQMNGILQTFADYEEENYGIFKYINEQSDELEHLEQWKKQLITQVEELELRPKLLQADQKIQYAQKLSQQIEKTQLRREKYQQKYKDLMKIMLSLKVSIPIMFERIGCNQEEYLQLLGDNFSFKEIDEDGVLRLLGVIEKRTNDILQMQNDAQETKVGLLERNGKIMEESNTSANQQLQMQKDKELDDQIIKTVDKFKEESNQGELKSQNEQKILTYDEIRNFAEKEWKKQGGKKKR